MEDEKKENKLTNKQKLFIAAYLNSFNATHAAREAGYSEKTARTQGSVLLTNPNIKKAIDFELNDIYDRQKKKLVRASDLAIKALVTAVEKGKGQVQINAANSILDRGGHKAIDRFQGDMNSNIKADVNIKNAENNKPSLLSSLFRKFDKGRDDIGSGGAEQ
jgi:hypothetical protein